MKRSLRIAGFLFASAFALMLLGAAVAGAGYVALARELPDVDALREVDFQVPLRVYSASGGLIAEFGEKKRVPVTYDEVPKDLINAFVAAEDQRFFEHPGVDYQGIARAIWYLVRTGEKGPGGSTITMQVARNFFLSREQTYLRKAREILLALKIERELSKGQIFELYLNKIYLGQRAYGVGAAAQMYYGKPLKDLNLAQFAMIAGLPKAPSSGNPISNPERALQRRAYVLGRMHELGLVGNARFREAMQAPITAQRHDTDIEVRAPYIAEMVRRQVVARFGEEAAYSDGYEVYTTIDGKRQAAAKAALRHALHAYDERHGWRGPVDDINVSKTAERQALRRQLSTYNRSGELINALVLAVDAEGATLFSANREQSWRLPWAGIEWAREQKGRNALGARPKAPGDVLSRGDVVRVRTTGEGPRLAQVPEVEGALVSIDPEDGRIVALVGGYDFTQSKFNRATHARRQPGSSFKPFIYSAALANGFTPATLVNDAPVVFQDAALESIWRPENYSGKFYGPTRLREALIHSRNLVSIRVLRSVGIRQAVNHIERFGLDAKQLPRNLSLSLGSASMTPLELTRGYAVFANGGYLVAPFAIERIVDSDGKTVFRATAATACEDCATPADEREGTPAAQSPVADKQPPAGPIIEPAPRVISRGNAYLIRSMMRDVVRYGTGRKALQLGRSDLAGKTGTTNDQRDAWFAGFNHALVTAAWVGFDQVRPLGRYETGGKAALPMWIEYMGTALEGVPEGANDAPSGMVTVRIDQESGLVTTADNPNAVFETFRAGHLPERESPIDAGGGGGVAGGDGGGGRASLF